MRGPAGALAVWVLAVGCSGKARLEAQTAPERPGDGALAAIEAAADSGWVDRARVELERWLEVRGPEADRGALARARFLRARLMQDPDSAEVEYLRVAIEGGSERGAAAWLRLGQLHLTREDPVRAREDLERLRADYPGSVLVPESWFWTGLALEAEGELDEACEAWRRAAVAAVRAGEGASETLRAARLAREACVPGALRLTVQIGAFRSRESAEEVRRRAAEAGFEARLEPPAQGLHRVRVGRFGTMEAARDTAERLRERGFSAAILRTED